MTGAFAARRTLLVAFRLGQQSLVAELQLSGLLVDGDDLHLDGVALVDEAFESVETLIVVLADVHETFLARQELEEGAELDDGNHFGVVDLTHLGNGADVLDPLDGGLDVVLVLRGDVDDAHFAFLFDIDDGVGLLLDFLYDLATFTDDSADEVFGYLDLDDARNKVFVVGTGFGDGGL